MLAFVIGSVILSCISIIMTVAVVATFATGGQKTAAKISNGSVLEVNFDSLNEKITTSPFDEIFAETKGTTLTLTEIINAIRKAKDEPKIEGIYLTANMPEGGLSSIDEVRRALLEFKESGKFIVAYGDTYSQKGYYLASTADELYLNPQGMVELNGIHISNIFYKKALENFGVQMQVFKVGTYKGAVEPFLLDKLSEPNREQISSFSGALWNHMLKGIAKERKLSEASLQELADNCPSFMTPQELIEAKIVDKAMFQHDVEELIKKKVNSGDDLNLVSLNTMSHVEGYEQKGKGTIGVLFAEGNIVSGKERGTITEELAQRLFDIADNDDVDAIVLRVNSPGGSSFVSEQIWNAVCYAKSQKPIVVSMGDYAASGGYYISCASSYIVAEPTTITGSIGIYGLFPNFAGTAQKFSITEDGVKTARFADFGNLLRPMREDEKAIMQRYIEKGYDTFITRVADGRKLSKEVVDSIGQGRVWTGQQALERKLVDKLGGLDEAIEKAAELADVTTYKVKYEQMHRDRFEELLETLSSSTSMKILSRILTKEELSALQQSRQMRENTGVQARLIYDIKL